jgi:hypothetical protein
MAEELSPVAGRECGDCTVCCIVTAIDKPEIQKAAGVRCRHCSGRDCAIYETRPPICRSFHCAWRLFDFFAEEWRPDKSGVFAEPVRIDGRTGMRLTLFRDPLQIVRQPWFVDFVAIGVRGNAPLVLLMPGPPGHLGASIMLNTGEMHRALGQSREKVTELLEKGVLGLLAFHFMPMSLVNTGNDVSTA